MENGGPAVIAAASAAATTMRDDNNKSKKKRYSGAYDNNLAASLASTTAASAAAPPAGLNRTKPTGKKGSSNTDRQGHVYDKDGPVQGAAIRPMTPNDSSSTIAIDQESPASASSRIGTSSLKHQPTLSSAPRSQALRHASTRDRYVADSEGKSSRPRTRTLDERARKTTSFENKVRNRMGSMHAVHPTNVSSKPIDTSSIGFPSIVPIPGVAQQRPTMTSPSRPLSPVLDSGVSIIPPGLPSPGSDTARIIQLMKTTTGRMHGILFFRMNKTGTWSSGYCAINVASGTLIYQMKGDVSHAKTLIPDLRGCTVRTQVVPEPGMNFLEIASRTSDFIVHLRPHVPETFESWLAALLCWQPIPPKDADPPKPNIITSARNTIRQSITNPRRNSSITLLRDAAIIKVGKMLYWDRDARPSDLGTGGQRISTYKQQRSASGTPWRKISCTLQENGLLKLYKDPDSVIVHQIPLSTLNRFAIQRLHPTVLEDEYCLAIYPQYRASNTTALDLQYPIFLSLETRILFEVWFVLLRAFTTAELYGPEQPSVRASVDLSLAETQKQKSNLDQLFRVERVVSLKIVEAKIHGKLQASTDTNGTTSERIRCTDSSQLVPGDYHAEALIDGEIRGRTAIKKNTGNPFWREEYEFYDLPPVISSTTILVKSRSSGKKDWYSIAESRIDTNAQDTDSLGLVSDIRVSPLDVVLGRVDIRLDDFERGKDFEQWWHLTNDGKEVVGEVLMKIRIDEAVVLMAKHYEQMSNMLHQFSSGLTQQIFIAVPVENRKLHETLLNVFQFSGHASEWLMSLIEDEIDGIHKDTPAPRYRYSRRIASNDSYDSGVERELILRDAGKNATQEANLLFRGNSLLTKALDFHMRRVGKEYLEETLGERMRDIDESDPDCEVDPNRIKNKDDLARNWRNLIALTESVWIAIKTAPARCPAELRSILRHIRACAEDRYGQFLRHIQYSSVSGFLFLRFFCPAILNPKLFGLLKDHPRPRALRTLTFIAKSLQCLANLSTFGSKEPWMDPMNQFISGHRQEFKDYIDQICTVSTDQNTPRVPPSYATPLTIFPRLPPTAKEGFPSLPYLIDQARELAALSNMWIEATGDNRPTVQDGEEIAAFDRLCYTIRERTRTTINHALRSDNAGSAANANLEGVAENFDKQSRYSVFYDADSGSSASKPTSPTSVSHPMAGLTRAARKFKDHAHRLSSGNSSLASRHSIKDDPVSPMVSHADTNGKSSPWAASPATSAAPSAAEWDPSEAESTEQYPVHAISWNKSTPQNGPPVVGGTVVDQDSGESAPRKSGQKRPENINTVIAAPMPTASDSGGSLKLPFSMSTSTYEEKSPVSPRENSRKFADVWGFRRKDKDKDQSRSEDSGNSSAKRGTLTKKDRDRSKRDNDGASSKASRDILEASSKGKGKHKK